MRQLGNLRPAGEWNLLDAGWNENADFQRRRWIVKERPLTCTACGKACNSASRLSLPELFRLQESFVGCLALRRLHRPRENGEKLEPFWSRLFHPMRTPGDWLLLATHAYDGALEPRSVDPRSAPRCEALEPTASDTQRETIDPSRRQLELDRRFWGDAVYRQLPRELLETALLPSDAFLSISIVPVLMVIARISEGCRQRCLGYLDAQAFAIQTALVRLPAHATQARRQLAGFAEDGAMLRQLLIDSPPEASVRSARKADAIERWLDTGTFEDAESEHSARSEYFAPVLEYGDTRAQSRVAILRSR